MKKLRKFISPDQTEASNAEEQLARNNLVKESKMVKVSQVKLLDLPMPKKKPKSNLLTNLKL
jgi:hypothetical protein